MMQDKLYKFVFLVFLFLPILVFAQTEKKKALFFYSEACPHCQEVEKYFEEENIYDKYEIRKIDVSGEYNFAFLNEFFDAFGISQQNRGWPAVFFGNEILVGSPPIVEEFVLEIDRVEAREFPSPEAVKKYFSETKNDSSKNIQSLRSMLPVIASASLIDSFNPRIFSAIFVLMFVLWPVSARRKFLFSIAGFLLAIFSVRLLSGVVIFHYDYFWPNAFRLISALMGILLITLSIVNLKYHLASVFNAIYRIRTGKLSRSWANFFKGLVVGVFSGLFLLPISGENYAVLVRILSEKISQGLPALSIYNFLFIIPLAVVALMINAAAMKMRVREFCIKNDLLIRIIFAVAMVAVGLYTIIISF